MGEFDDVLAAEPGEEWADFDAGLDLCPQVELAPLAAELCLPNAWVELRGDVPETAVDASVDLTDERLAPWQGAPRVVLTVGRVDGGFELVDQELGVVASVADEHDLTGALVDTLASTAARTDPTTVHLAAANLELDLDGERVGVLLVDPDDRRRHQLVVGLIAAGAAYLGADSAELLAGSRTTFALPTPMLLGRNAAGSAARGSGPGRWVPGSQVGRVVPWATTRLVVLVDPLGRDGDGDRDRDGDMLDGDMVTELAPADGLVELLHRAGCLERHGADVLDMLAAVASDSRFLRLRYDPADPLSCDQAITELCAVRPVGDRRLVVVHHLASADGTALRVMSTGTGGVVAASDRPSALAISSDELEALERRCLLGRSDPADSATLARLQDEGVRLPDPRSARPLPLEAFGLPNVPTGAVAAELWSSTSAPATAVSKGASARAGTRPVLGAIGAAVRRGALELDDVDSQQVLDEHDAAQAAAALVDRVLRDVLDRLDDVGVAPIVVGAVVVAHDGVLPPEFTDVERVDLLVDVDEAPRVVDELVAADFSETPAAETPAASNGIGHVGDPMVLTSPDGVPVRLHVRLSVGPFSELVDHDEIRDRSVPVWLAGRWCRSLHPQDRFVLAGLQLDLRGGAHSVQELRELVVTAPRVGSLMASALDASDRWGATRNVLSALRVVDSELPGLPQWLTVRSRHPESNGSRRRGWRSRRVERRRALR